MKRCARCKRRKADGAFALKYKDSVERASYCKRCATAYKKARQRQYPHISARQQKRWHQQRKDWIDSLKTGKPCPDCGGNFPAYVMDFHHRDERTKHFSIATCARYKSKKELLREIEKCDLICANCHRIREYLRRKKLIA